MGTHFFWDPVEDNIIQERDDTAAVTADYTTEPYLYGDLISQRRDGESRFYCFDGQGSTLRLTDATASVTDTYTYTGFGEATERTGTTASPFRYLGQKQYCRLDLFSELLVRRRALKPTSGRWLSVDPIGFAHNGSRYRYSANNPAVHSDPSGELCFREIILPIPANRFTCSDTYRWVIDWDPAPGRNGYILQRIATRFWALACDRSSYEFSSRCPTCIARMNAVDIAFELDLRGRLPDPEECVYWELWPVRDGKVFNRSAMVMEDAGDTFLFENFDKSWGAVRTEATAFFFERESPPPPGGPPPGDWPIWKEDPQSPAKGIPFTCHDDPHAVRALTKGEKLVQRSFSMNWCCCEPMPTVSVFTDVGTGRCR